MQQRRLHDLRWGHHGLLCGFHLHCSEHRLHGREHLFGNLLGLRWAKPGVLPGALLRQQRLLRAGFERRHIVLRGGRHSLRWRDRGHMLGGDLWIVWWSRRFLLFRQPMYGPKHGLRASLRVSQVLGLWRNRRALLRHSYQLGAHLQSMARVPKADRHLFDLRRLRGSWASVLSRRCLQDRYLPKRRELPRLTYWPLSFARSSSASPFFRR